jgi:hypothetical protein
MPASSVSLIAETQGSQLQRRCERWVAGTLTQRPQGARFVTVVVGLGQVGLAHLLEQHAPAREHLHQPGNDGLQQRVQLVVAGRAYLDEAGQAVGVAPIHPVQQEAEQVKVEVGR